MAKSADPVVPPMHNWRTSDVDEINRRRLRARTEGFRVRNTKPSHPIFSNFSVQSPSGIQYEVEVFGLEPRHVSCNCVDFQINGLGTCKHAEAVLLYIEARHKRLLPAARKGVGRRIDVLASPEDGSLRLSLAGAKLPKALKAWFDSKGAFHSEKGTPEQAVEALKRLNPAAVPDLRLSREVDGWLEMRRRAEESKALRREYEMKVQQGEWPSSETKVPLFPYQREGMLHLAFVERALLADEMGLGKTIQAIAACALLRRLGKISRVLVVTPASLKGEWEEQIQRFTDLSYQLVYGNRIARMKAYELAGSGSEISPFFTIVNYEQMLLDALEVNNRLKPDVVILDEAQRIKNWSAKTSQAIKRLRSRYAFVLTGTPIENRLDELFSLMGFLDPAVLGPLFRFNREFYQLDDRGRPTGFCNLDRLHERIKPLMLRRRKAEVETELPPRTNREHFVPLSASQMIEYENHEAVVSRLASAARRRPLTQQEQEKLLRHLNMMRMVCDTNFILDEEDSACPKLQELEKVLEECRENPDVKVIIFSEWERMLQLVSGLARKMDLGFAWHTGSVPQKRRRAEINLFKTDPQCRLFLSTDSGAAGLNLQNASVVVNCDLPWNPAKLEQRIARAWRKHQTRNITVINLVSENTIEHRMLATLQRKQALADGVLDLKGDLREIKFQGGKQAFLSRLEQLVSPARSITLPAKPPPMLPADRPRGFAEAAKQRINGALLRCEERYPMEGPHSVVYVVVDRDSAKWRQNLEDLHTSYFGPGQCDPLAPVRLEVIDRATDEAIERLIEAGMLTRGTRAIRPLLSDSPATEPAPLSPEQQAQAATHREQAKRKLKMARLLGDGGLLEEARAALGEALHPLGKALAIENRLPEPAQRSQLTLPPLTSCFGDALPLIRDFEAGQGDWKSLTEKLGAL